jgi:hypothetical protein
MMWKSMRCLRLSRPKPSVAVDGRPARRRSDAAAEDRAGSLTAGKLNMLDKRESTSILIADTSRT